jgi:hypothetical protein
VWNALTVGVNGVGAGAAGQEQRGGCLVEEERADAELEEQQRARGQGGGGGRGGQEGVPGGRGRQVLRERRVVAQPRAPRAAGLQPPRELVAEPVLAQQLRRHPRGGPRFAGISVVSDAGGTSLGRGRRSSSLLFQASRSNSPTHEVKCSACFCLYELDCSAGIKRREIPAGYFVHSS